MGVGTQHRPDSVRSCEPALRADQAARGSPRGVASRRFEGRLRLGARPPPAARPRGGHSGSTADVLWARVCGRRGPALSLSWTCPAGGCVPRGWREVVLRGLTSCRYEGRLVSGAFPQPPPLPGAGSQAQLSVFPRRGWCGRGDPAPASQRVLLRAGVARSRGGRRASPGGGAPRRCEERLRSGSRPPPAARPQGGQSGSAAPKLWAPVCKRRGPALSLWRACPAGGCAPRGWRKVVPGA